MSSSPRTAFTGVPSGALKLSGTPWKARKYNDAVSSSISRLPGSGVSHAAILPPVSTERRTETARAGVSRAFRQMPAGDPRN